MHVQQFMLYGPGQIRALRGVDPVEGKPEIDAAQDFHHVGLVEEHDGAIRRARIGSLRAKFGDIPIPVRTEPLVVQVDNRDWHDADGVFVRYGCGAGYRVTARCAIAARDRSGAGIQASLS